jgi:hypothetical protein
MRQNFITPYSTIFNVQLKSSVLLLCFIISFESDFGFWFDSLRPMGTSMRIKNGPIRFLKGKNMCGGLLILS